MKRVGRLFFLLAFALLQCTAPLAHAHLGGDASGSAFHVFHFNGSHHSRAHDHTARMSSDSHRLHASDLPVVKVPDGKRRGQPNAALIAPQMLTTGIRLSVPSALSKFARLNDERIPLPPPYFRRHAQAPPVRA